MKIAVIGLGKMGAQLAKRFVDGGHEVAGFDEQSAAVTAASVWGVQPASSRLEVAQFFGDQPAIIWLMIPAAAVTAELTQWYSHIQPTSVIIDGGNSDYRQTQLHAEQARTHSLHLVDVGTSGGVLGLQNGFSLMVGGDPEVFAQIEPLLQSLSQPHGGYIHAGPTGAGHYVKMVHNAIEYGIMESLAEGYGLLHEQHSFPGLDLAAIASVWQRGSIIASQLNNLVAEVITENPQLDGIGGTVVESGEARWTLEIAAKDQVSMPAIQAALDVRLASEAGQVNYATKLLAALRNKFGGHPINGTRP